MTRKLYLIRHGAVTWPEGERLCLGRSELPLSAQGRFQAGLLKLWFAEQGAVTAFSSPLSRCRETAETVFGAYRTADGLAELDMGQWDGLPFAEIRRRWPEEYEKRGQDALHTIPPDAEAPEAALRRFKRALSDCLAAAEGDIAVLSHAGVLRLLLCEQTNGAPDGFMTMPLPYGSVSILHAEQGRLHLQERGIVPQPKLGEAECLSLLRAVGCDAELIAHCRAVQARAAQLAQRLAAAGVQLDMALVRAGALLHDMARALPDHAAEAGRWLREAGYAELAAVVARHHSAQSGALDEAAVLSLADRLTLGAAPVTIEARFAASRKKCTTAEAVAAHERRFRETRALLERFEALCGGVD